MCVIGHETVCFQLVGGAVPAVQGVRRQPRDRRLLEPRWPRPGLVQIRFETGETPAPEVALEPLPFLDPAKGGEFLVELGL